jgi:phosphate transport system substrate-binding protein
MNKVLAAALAVTVAFALNGAALYAEEMLNGAGATFPYPVYSAWANEYNKITGMKLNYQSIGSGGGIKQITERTVDFGASDKPLTPEELAKANLLQFPAVIGGVVPVINIPGIKAGELKLDADAVCRIYMGEIKNWSDPKIKELNPKLNLPASEITVVHRSRFRTTATSRDYLSDVVPPRKTKWVPGLRAGPWASRQGTRRPLAQQQKNSIGMPNPPRQQQNSSCYGPGTMQALS